MTHKEARLRDAAIAFADALSNRIRADLWLINGRIDQTSRDAARKAADDSWELLLAAAKDLAPVGGVTSPLPNQRNLTMSHLTDIPMPASKPFVRHLTIIAHNAEPSLKLSPPGAKAEPWDVGVTVIADVNQSRSDLLHGGVTIWYLPGADGSEWGTHGARLEIWCDGAFMALADKHEIANLIVLIESAACEAARERCHATRTFAI